MGSTLVWYHLGAGVAAEETTIVRAAMAATGEAAAGATAAGGVAAGSVVAGGAALERPAGGGEE